MKTPALSCPPPGSPVTCEHGKGYPVLYKAGAGHTLRPTAVFIMLEAQWLPKAGQRVKMDARMPRYATAIPVMISVTINGEHRQFEAPINCADLIAQLELAGKRVALERNGEIVPRSQHAEQRLTDGDRLEIVVAVGGG